MIHMTIPVDVQGLRKAKTAAEDAIGAMNNLLLVVNGLLATIEDESESSDPTEPACIRNPEDVRGLCRRETYRMRHREDDPLFASGGQFTSADLRERLKQHGFDLTTDQVNNQIYQLFRSLGEIEKVGPETYRWVKLPTTRPRRSRGGKRFAQG